METNRNSQERNDLFQKLKPCCVRISQLAIRESDIAKAAPELSQLVRQVLAILNDQIQKSPGVLDSKLAEYVFFPLYHIFRQVDSFPMSLVEICIKCLTILIRYGWKSDITPKLVQQILSLMTFIVDGVPGTEGKRDVPEETTLEAFRAQTTLLTTAGSSATAASGLAESDMVPILGHGITVMLEAAVDGPTPAIQQEAIRSTQAVYTSLREHDALANFLPGSVSTFANILSKPNRHKVAVLTQCLEAVTVILTRVLADLRTRSIISKAKEEESNPPPSTDKAKLLSPSWLKATTSQVKIALSTIVKLRSHNAPHVQHALERLCVSLLDECHVTLSNCTAILVETAIIVDSESAKASVMETSLTDLVNIYPNLGEAVKTIVYGWITSLSRHMQASDETIKQTAIQNISKGIKLLRTLGIESSTLDDTISSNLRDCIASLLSSSTVQPAEGQASVQMLDTQVVSVAQSSDATYQSVLLGHQSQKGLREKLNNLISTIGATSQQSSIAITLLEYMRQSTSTTQVAAFWLSFELIKAANASSLDVGTFLDLSSFAGSPDDLNTPFNDLYNFSVQVLDSHTESGSGDWRLEAIAMEVTAYAAQRSGKSFRPELIDVLFPITTFLGSDIASLQQHAVMTLNFLASSCEYSDVSELIVANVDYMVDSVSLRLNTLDISPSSTQVLLMMIRLAGPRLIPFLDDVVESIFAALDNYHGYPIFVASLFAVLKEVVDQATREDVRLLTARETSAPNHKKRKPSGDGLDGLFDFIHKQKARDLQDAAEDEAIASGNGHPETPWKSEPKGEADAEDQAAPPPEEEKPPNSPTYQLLLRIATLTQHYLTSPTPQLRRVLLELLTTSAKILAGDEDAFLPLVNAIWPVVISRLYDTESFIVIEACQALSGLCEGAGDFLSSRFQTEWSDGLRAWCFKIKEKGTTQPSYSKSTNKKLGLPTSGKELVIPLRSGSTLVLKTKSEDTSQSTSGSLGQFASPVKVWEAVVGLLTAIVSYVRVDAVMFDDIVELLADVLEWNTEVREALRTINPGAVWQARYERGRLELLPTPKLDGFEFAEMEMLSRD